MLKNLKQDLKTIGLSDEERKRLKKQHKKLLVKRSALYKTITAWVITVPAPGIMAALFYFMIRGMLI